MRNEFTEKRITHGVAKTIRDMYMYVRCLPFAALWGGREEKTASGQMATKARKQVKAHHREKKRFACPVRNEFTEK